MNPRTIIVRGPLQHQSLMKLCREIEPDDECPVRVSFTTQEPSKTVTQRNTWHWMLGQMADQAGYTLKEMKFIVKDELLPPQVVMLPDGSEKEMPGSSEDESKFSYSKLIDETFRLASEWLGMNIVLKETRY